MTDKQFELLEKYWIDFSKLVARYVDKVPANEVGDMLMYMQEKSSVYGSAYGDYVKKHSKDLV